MQAQALLSDPAPAADTGGAAGALTTGVQGDLAAMVATIDARFTPAGDALAELIPTIEAALGGLDILQKVLGESAGKSPAGEALVQAAQALRRAPDRHAGRMAQAAGIGGVVRRLEALSRSIGQVMTVLQFYTVNLKIAAAGADGFVEFANDMSVKLAAGRSEVEEFNREIRRVKDGLAGMHQVDDRFAQECRRVIPLVPDKLEWQVDELGRQQAWLGDLGTEARANVLRLQGQVAAALGAIQIADITRQRLEHVQAGCAMLDAAIGREGPHRSAGARRHVLDMLADQLVDLGDGFGKEAGELQGALATLAPDCERLLALAKGTGAGPDRGNMLEDLGACIADARSLAGQLDDATAQATGMAETVCRTIAALRDRVQAIESLRYDVDYMAINATLRARRNQVIGRPVAVIASEIRHSSRELAGLIREVTSVAGDLDRLGGQISGGMAGDPEPAIGNLLEGALALVGDALAASDRATSELEQRAGIMAAAIGHARTELGACAGFAGQLAGMASNLEALAAGAPHAASPEDDELTRDLMAAIARTYTMGSERAVHDRHLLPGMVASASGGPVPTSADCPPDDDDTLFDDALF